MQGPGRLDPDPYWKTTFAMAKQYGKRVGFRVQMSDPDIDEPALPDFVLAGADPNGSPHTVVVAARIGGPAR
jgi:hypothetical protein